MSKRKWVGVFIYCESNSTYTYKHRRIYGGGVSNE